MIDSAARSRIMRSIRKKDTKAELTVRRAVHALGYRFRLHRSDLPGSPDLVLPRHRKVIFVNGCFWHQHPGCPKGTVPRKRLGYWAPKLQRNVARDARALADLSVLGWQTMVLWECELLDEKALLRRLGAFIRPPLSSSRGRMLSSPSRFRDAPGATREVRETDSVPVPGAVVAEAGKARRAPRAKGHHR